MKAVITGATSFIGAAAVRRALLGGYDVCAVVRPGSAHLAHLREQTPEEARGRLRIAAVDLTELEGSQALSGEQYDVWLHAGWDGAGSENRTKRDVQQGNVTQTLSAVRRAAGLGCRRFVFTGSQAEYGICHEPLSETHECSPVSEYGRAKLNVCRQAAALCEELGMEYIHTRIFSVYGPGDHPWSLVQSCLRTWEAGGRMELGECTQQWNYLYIDDAARSLCCFLTEGSPGIYNVAGRDTRPLRSYIGELYRLCGERGSFVYGERPQNAEGAADLIPDITKILRETSWRPEVSFAEGIHRMRAPWLLQ